MKKTEVGQQRRRDESRERASGARGAGKGGGRGTTVPGQGARGRPSAQSVFPKKRHVERENTQKQNTRAFSRDKKLKLWIKGT